MGDEENDEELPSISMNSSVRNSDVLSMPSAELLATQRAREEACEQELMTLRAHHDVAALTDSSGSEGEAALAAAVGALVMAGGASLSPGTSPLPGLLARLAPAHASALLQATPDTLETLTDEVCGAVESECLHSEQEVVFAGAWLCVRGAGAGRRIRRALHRLLESHAFHHLSETSFESLSRALLETREPSFLRAEMADVLSAAAGEGERIEKDGDEGEGMEIEREGQSSGGQRCATLILRLLADTVSQLLGHEAPQVSEDNAEESLNGDPAASH
ncbi:unnamed protein product [Chilo suppressalis]|uniref:Uncharacterized protein n=1 Tax=Chilo suppressalis TaxID=168631 RepID=A0ABN8L866_CHISP|nr:unnamed protein product [Chilo suppressalis]